MAKRTAERRIDMRGMLAPDRMIDLVANTKYGVIRELCDVTAGHGSITDPDRFIQAIHDREKLMSTGIGSGVAIPHAKIPSVKDFVVSVGRSRGGVDFEALDGNPVHIVILIGAPRKGRRQFLSLMAKIGQVFNDPDFRDRFLAEDSSEAMYRMLIERFDSP